MDQKPSYLDKQSIAGQIYNLLKNEIYNQELLPDQKINISQVAEKLKCSIAPVREALSRLYAEKLVDFAPYRGYVVTASLDESLFLQLFEVRALLELKATEHATGKITNADLNQMEKIIKSGDIKIKNTDSYEQFKPFIEANYQFHLFILTIAGNSFLLDAWNSLYIKFHLSRLYYQRRYVNTEPQTNGHYEIYRALTSRNPKAAVNAMKDHLSGGFGRLFLKSNQNY